MVVTTMRMVVTTTAHRRPMQLYKSVYFADHPGLTPQRRVVKLAFGPRDTDIFDVAGRFSSEEIRRAIGMQSFAELKTAADTARMSLNAFCLWRLRDALSTHNDGQLVFPELTHDDIRLDPIQATFRGGKEDPLHNWYPYLEGYSPDFVHSILNNLAPRARRVLDPFAGTGTTPLTVARRGGLGLYCELNPLLQFLIETKAGVLALPPKERAALSCHLTQLASELPVELASQVPDRRLEEAYADTFADSEFFPAEAHEAALKLRSWLDTLACDAPEAASLATIACVAALIPSSNLIRRGDLRFRKGAAEKRLRSPDLTAEVRLRLREIAGDLVRIQRLDESVFLVASDAKRLDRCVPLDADAIVTSPPYLNGTNYYRNTKIELWFIRALHTGRDLAAFRHRTVTAGINDVTVNKTATPASAGVEAVVRDLGKHSYDRRIPQMVLNYFSDMAQVFDHLVGHVRSGAALFMDIGDSAYANVHVDTPRLLSELLQERRWRVGRELVLRQRLSRGGLKLRQVLITAEAPARPSPRTSRQPWRFQWERFKADLPHQRDEYAKRNWGHPLHALCSYQGKMKPSLAHHLVATFVTPGDRVLDPFGGVGTIPFEAALRGAHAWSFDISPAAVPIAAAKLQPSSIGQCRDIIDNLDSYIRNGRATVQERLEAAEVRFNGSLPDYFNERTLDAILLARRYFQQHSVIDGASALVFASLLHVLHGNRPYALSRRSHPITPFAPTGDAPYKNLVQKVLEKVQRALAVDRPTAFVPGVSLFQDATSPWPVEVDELDAVITSPPFFDSTRFYLANWMRLWFAGWSAEDFRKRPLAFIDERQKQTFSVYKPILRQARERLKPGGVCVLHLGRSKKCDMAKEIAKVARRWFAHADIFSESVAHCESHGIRDKGTVVEHAYVVLY